ARFRCRRRIISGSAENRDTRRGGAFLVAAAASVGGLDIAVLGRRFSPRGPRGIRPPFLRGESVQSLNKIHLFRSLRGPSQLRLPIEGFRLLPYRSFCYFHSPLGGRLLPLRSEVNP